MVSYANCIVSNSQHNSDRGYGEISFFLMQKTFKKLLELPEPCTVKCTPEVDASLKLLGRGIRDFGQRVDEPRVYGKRPGKGGMCWSQLKPYWQWVIALHHNEMICKFGSLAVVDPDAVPVGMVDVFKRSRLRWDQ